MSEIQNLMLSKIDKMETDIGDIKVTIAENTTDMKHHIKRTDDLQLIVTEVQQLVTPIYQEHIAKKAIEDYKKKQREELVYKLKLPGYIAAALAAIGTIAAFFMRR